MTAPQTKPRNITIGIHEDVRKRKVRTTKWVVFTVVFGISPLFATWVVGTEPFSLEAMIGHGELYLIAAVLTADAFGRIWNPKATNDVWGTICLGLLGLILGYAFLEFGKCSPELASGGRIDVEYQRISLAVFIASVLSAYAAVRLEE